MVLLWFVLLETAVAVSGVGGVDGRLGCIDDFWGCVSWVMFCQGSKGNRDIYRIERSVRRVGRRCWRRRDRVCWGPEERSLPEWLQRSTARQRQQRHRGDIERSSLCMIYVYGIWK